MIKYVLMAVILFLLFRMNTILGVAATVIFILYVLYTNRAALYARKGNEAFNKNDQKKALEYYKKAYDTQAASANIMITYGILLLRNAYPSEAVTVFNMAVAKSNGKNEVKNKAKQYRALAYFKMGNTQDAMEEAEELFENYKNTVSYALICYLKLATNAPAEETLALCKEAYDYNSDERDICDNLALSYIVNGEYDKAKEILNNLLEKEPEFTEAYYHMALACAKSGEKEKAKELLSEIEDKCTRTYMTTVSKEEIEELKTQLDMCGK